jgi:hypothetical protein
MEAVVAAGFSAVALSASLLILNRQTEMVQKARDLALIQAAVNEDINAIRHEARFWWWANSYYRNPVPGSTPPSEMIYSPSAECNGLNTPGKMESRVWIDLAEYPYLIKGGIPIQARGAIAKTVPGYLISRNYEFPTAQSSTSTTTQSVPSDQRFNTLRVTYSVRSVKTGSNGSTTSTPYPFEATRDILIPAQFSC